MRAANFDFWSCESGCGPSFFEVSWALWNGFPPKFSHPFHVR